MISMSRCGCLPKPMRGITRSSLITRRLRKTHPLRIVVIREAEGVIAIEPAVLGVGLAHCFFRRVIMAPRLRASPAGFRKYHVPCLSIREKACSFAHGTPVTFATFVAVAEEQNVTSRIGESCTFSQPAVSRQIRDLEDELGLALLERSAKARAPDRGGAGFFFSSEARAVLERRGEAPWRTCAPASDGLHGELHVGYAPSLTAPILPRRIAQARGRFTRRGA